MRATLIHNPTAGYGKHTPQTLLKLLKEQGYKANYQSTDDDDWQDALAEPGELIVAAGGDGTVDLVMSHYPKLDVPLAILPLGTANNIARELGIVGEPEEVVGHWKNARRKNFDIGLAKGPWGKKNFVESIGFGAFAQMMPVLTALGAQYSHVSEEDHLRHELTALRALVEACRSLPWEIEIDGEEIAGDYVLIEIMNISTVGPGLRLAPKADPGDGLLDIMLIEEADRELFDAYLLACIERERPAADLPTRRAEHVRLTWHGTTVHLDSNLWSGALERMKGVKHPKKDPPRSIDIRLEKHALEVLMP